MKITVKITKEILKRSMYCGIDKKTLEKLPNEIANIGRSCGIANAVSDLFETAWVENFSIKVYERVPTFQMMCRGEYLSEIPLPNEATKFIKDFDKLLPNDRKNMKPFSFEIDIDDSIIQRIGIKEVETILSKSSTLELVKV